MPWHTLMVALDARREETRGTHCRAPEPRHARRFAHLLSSLAEINSEKNSCSPHCTLFRVHCILLFSPDLKWPSGHGAHTLSADALVLVDVRIRPLLHCAAVFFSRNCVRVVDVRKCMWTLTRVYTSQRASNAGAHVAAQCAGCARQQASGTAIMGSQLG